MEAMDDFDTVMSYLANPVQMDFLHPSDYGQTTTTGMELGDQTTNLDAQAFASGNGFTFEASNAAGIPSPQRFGSSYGSSYDDFFPETNYSNVEPTIPEQTVDEDTALDRENKLLGFSKPIYSFTLLDCFLRRTSLTVSAHLHGMFFLAEPQLPANPKVPPPSPELTCYRRNLFQITGSITMPRNLRYILTDQGDRIPILAQELTVSATESVEGKAVKIISVPWKTPAGSASAAADAKVEEEPSPIPLDTVNGSELDTDYAVFPIQWKRLQFRIATANNGRRKELQQHFVLSLKFVATLSTGTKIKIAEVRTGAVIVRGRSPRNFQSRKDLPLSTSAVSTRRTLGASVCHSSVGDKMSRVSQSKRPKSQHEEAPVSLQQYEKPCSPLETTNLGGWNQRTHSKIPEPLPTPDYQNSAAPLQMPLYPNIDASELSPMMGLTEQKLPAFNDLTGPSFSSEDEQGSTVPLQSRPPVPRAPTSNPLHSGEMVQDLSRLADPSPSSLPTPGQTPPKPRQRLTTPQPPSSSSHNTYDPSSTAPPHSTSFPLPSSSTQSPVYSDHHNNNSYLDINALGSNGETAVDLAQYEYFPLEPDDWRPPLASVLYLQHGDHHHHRHQHYHTTSPTPPKEAFIAMTDG